MSALGPPGSRSLLAAALIGTSATLIVGVLGVARTKALALGLDPDGLGLYGQVLAMLTTLSAGAGLGLGTTRVATPDNAPRGKCPARPDDSSVTRSTPNDRRPGFSPGRPPG